MVKQSHSIALIAGAVAITAIFTADPAAAQGAQPRTVSGTEGRIAKFTSSNDVGNSVLRENGGRIGINIGNPRGLFHVNNVTDYPRRRAAVNLSAAHFDLDLGHTFTGLGFTDQGGTTNGYGAIWQWGGRLQFQSAEGTLTGSKDAFSSDVIGPSVAHMTIDKFGRVGINTITPQEGRLHVVGPQAIYGQGTQDSSAGVFGYSSHSNGAGVIGANQFNNGLTGWFQGKVRVDGTLTKPAGSFLIDHPLDPANKTLSHSFVESPDMMNIYNGNAVLDADGRASIELPGYFGALNKDFRYQLTAIGAPAPGLHVAEEVADNRFVIAGGRAGQKVSWQVTGVRQDPYAMAHRIPVEENKPAREQGLYLHPLEIGQPESKGLTYVLNQRAKARMREGDESSAGSRQQASLPQ